MHVNYTVENVWVNFLMNWGMIGSHTNAKAAKYDERTHA